MLPVKSKLAMYTLSLLFILTLNACSPSADAASYGTYPVSSTFLDFYREFGGEANLGPAISPAFEKENITYQYVVAGLLVYDPNLGTLNRFKFSPIASTEWKINGLVEPPRTNDDLPYLNGHRIWEEVWSFYSSHGAEILGLPVSGVSANDAMQRYEQYFEGVGFYRNYADPIGKIHLLPYGSWMCGKNCNFQLPDAVPPPASYVRENSQTEQLFLQETDRLGYGFSGEPLSAPRIAEDGNFEMVFENIILFIDPSNGNQIRPRPLPSLLGIMAEMPTKETKADWLLFYEVGEGLGYNVPVTFSQYISEHGGATYSGYPITEYQTLADDGYSQCYTNICLEYHPTAPEALRTRPHALGAIYVKNGANTAVTEPSFSEALKIDVWEDFPLIASGERQVINVEASQNDAPSSGIEVILLVKQPDGIMKTYKLDPTDNAGKTRIELEPINGPNGAIVQYQVCLTGTTTPQVCFSRSYTIWEQ